MRCQKALRVDCLSDKSSTCRGVLAWTLALHCRKRCRREVLQGTGGEISSTAGKGRLKLTLSVLPLQTRAGELAGCSAPEAAEPAAPLLPLPTGEMPPCCEAGRHGWCRISGEGAALLPTVATTSGLTSWPASCPSS